MSSFLRKAKNSLNDVKEIKTRLEAMGIDKAKVQSTYAAHTGKAKTPAAEAPAELPATAAAPVTTEKEVVPPTPSSTTGASTILTPATTATPSVAPSTAADAPTKLPLAAKKSIRDDFESKRENFEGRLTKALGTPWKLYVDAPGVYSYSAGKDFPQQNPGLMLAAYFGSAVEYVEKFVTAFGADGVAQLNAVAPSHTVTLEPSTDPSIMYCSCAIQHDALVVLFRDTALGTNADLACEKVGEKISAAGAAIATAVTGSAGDTLNLVARKSIASDWDTKAPGLTEAARKYLQAPTLTLVPNFEANYAKMRAWEAKGNKQTDPQWDSKIGAATEEYFSGFVSYLKAKNFHEDDMLQEGFKEAVDRNEVVLRVVDELSEGAKTGYHDRYHGCLVEGGTLYIETLPGSWWSNAANATDKLIDRL